MTIQRFDELEQEVLELVENVMNSTANKSFEDYVLLIIHADYNDFYVKHKSPLNLSPYVIEDSRDELIDSTHQRLLVQYMNAYRGRIANHVFGEDETKEIEMNIQLMIYCHVWESHLFLKELERIALILSGEGYKWKSSVSNTSKTSFIKQNIIQKLEKSYTAFAEYIRGCYDEILRNDFAHSTYNIDFDSGVIHSYKDGFMGGCSISFYDWQVKFVKSVLLSYYLSKCIKMHEDRFIIKYGDNPVSLKRPLMNKPQKNQCFQVKPRYIDSPSGKFVRFSFFENK